MFLKLFYEWGPDGFSNLMTCGMDLVLRTKYDRILTTLYRPPLLMRLTVFKPGENNDVSNNLNEILSHLFLTKSVYTSRVIIFLLGSSNFTKQIKTNF